jgi:hypothetical protein
MSKKINIRIGLALRRIHKRIDDACAKANSEHAARVHAARATVAQSFHRAARSLAQTRRWTQTREKWRLTRG